MEKKNQPNMIYLEEPSVHKERRMPTQEEIERAVAQTGIDRIYKANVSKEEAERNQKAIAEMFGI